MTKTAKDIIEEYRIQCDRAAGFISEEFIPAYSKGACEKIKPSKHLDLLIMLGANKYASIVKELARINYRKKFSEAVFLGKTCEEWMEIIEVKTKMSH